MTIPSELLEFKSTISPAISQMYASVTNIDSSAKDSISAIKDAKEDIKLSYKSTNLDAVLSKFSEIESEYNSISGALCGSLKSILDSCKSLVSKIGILEEILSKIDALEAEKQERLSRANEDESVDTSDLDSKIENLKKEFENEVQSCLSLLSQIKGMDTSI